MEKIGLFFGSDTGCTEEVVEKIKDSFTKDISLHNIADSSLEDIKTYERLIFASSTWGDGDLQNDWEDFESNLEEIDFTNKTVALVGLGDQDGYGETFCNALGHLYTYVKDGNVVGFTSTEGYDFEDSTAILDDKFVGLVLDEDNQSELTDERIQSWVSQIEDSF